MLVLIEDNFLNMLCRNVKKNNLRVGKLLNFKYCFCSNQKEKQDNARLEKPNNPLTCRICDIFSGLNIVAANEKFNGTLYVKHYASFLSGKDTPYCQEPAIHTNSLEIFHIVRTSTDDSVSTELANNLFAKIKNQDNQLKMLKAHLNNLFWKHFTITKKSFSSQYQSVY